MIWCNTDDASIHNSEWLTFKVKQNRILHPVRKLKQQRQIDVANNISLKELQREGLYSSVFHKFECN